MKKIKLTPIEDDFDGLYEDGFDEEGIEPGIELDLTAPLCVIGAICAALAVFALVWRKTVK